MTKAQYQKIIHNQKIRQNRQRQLRRFCLALCGVIILTLLAVFTTKAAGSDEAKMNKYYTNLCVYPGDTLCSIAEAYMDEAHYEDSEDYIYEVCTINHLTDADDIHAGDYLVVPYYSSEIK